MKLCKHRLSPDRCIHCRREHEYMASIVTSAFEPRTPTFDAPPDPSTPDTSSSGFDGFGGGDSGGGGASGDY